MTMHHRPLKEIAAEIQRDWKQVGPAARRYLDELHKLDVPGERFHADSGIAVVIYFLASARLWHGPAARRIKLELREIVRIYPVT
ncbi:MAG TPA: hypothetical protein VKT73_00130 [Xanthobacteraceae bacterium]|nr:hypothetical protein [Xanthobacteraceae bacterium]